MIIAVCQTNLDDFKCENWPEEFVELPREGDWVEAKSGACLKIVKITHCSCWGNFGYRVAQSSGPYIKVELSRIIPCYTGPK